MKFVLSVLLFSNVAVAEVLRYTDEQGREHYVDSPEKIPPDFREQVNNQKALPTISRAKPGREELYEKQSYPQEFTSSRGVEIFVTSWCPHCRDLETYLSKRGIMYSRYDIEADPAAQNRYEALGGGGVPLIRIGKAVLQGFDPMKVEAALNLAR